MPIRNAAMFAAGLAGLVLAVSIGWPRYVAGARYPGTLGWMDGGGPLSEADRLRISQIAAAAKPEATDVIAEIQAGTARGLSRRDFELLRQDRRRAAAAHPDVPADRLLGGGWIAVDLEDKVPEAFCTSGNFSGSVDSDGRSYLDGPCYVGLVRDEYPGRTDGATATATLARLKAERLAQAARYRAENGYHYLSAGSGGRLSIDCEAGGKCVVVDAREWATRALRYVFDYVPSEWGGDPAKFRSLPSFADAVTDEIDVEPAGVATRTHVGTQNDPPPSRGAPSPTAPPPAVPQGGK